MPDSDIKMISIPVKEHRRLLRKELFLDCLQIGGVDNWDWYSEAQIQYEEKLEELELKDEDDDE